ncbi:MAG: hypothetical protein KA140_05375 [Caldisericia bacterium]|nr:hypothetical protein [Caldisericia bacterium]
MKLFSYILPFVLILVSCGQEVTNPTVVSKNDIPPDQDKHLSQIDSKLTSPDHYKLIIPKLVEDISTFNVKGLDKPICTIKDAALNAFGDDEITLFKNNLYYTNTKNEMVAYDPIKNKKIWVNNDIDWSNDYIDFNSNIIDDIALNNAFNIKTGKFSIPYSKENPISVIDTEKDCIIVASSKGLVSKYNYKTNKTIWTTELDTPKEAYVDAVYSRGIIGNCLITNGRYARGKGECTNKYGIDIDYQHFEYPTDYLCAIDTNSGEIRFSCNNSTTYQIDNEEKKIYVYADGKILCYDIMSNKEEWTVDLKGNELRTLNNKYALAQTPSGYSLFDMSNGQLSWEFKVPYKEFLLKKCDIGKHTITLEIYSDQYLEKSDGYCGDLISFHTLESFEIQLATGVLLGKSIIFNSSYIQSEIKYYNDYIAKIMPSGKGIGIWDLKGNLILEINDNKRFPEKIYRDHLGLNVEYHDEICIYNDSKLTSTIRKKDMPDMCHYEIDSLWLDFDDRSLTVEDYKNKTIAYYLLQGYDPNGSLIFQDEKKHLS